MIYISKPRKEIINNYAYLSADISISDSIAKSWLDFSRRIDNDFSYISNEYINFIQEKGNKIYFKVDKEYQESFCVDRADAFIAAMLYYAMAVGEDINSEGPVSEELLFKLNYLLIPTLCNKNTGFKKISINAKPIKKILPNKGYVGTGMSCGIDSLHTLWQHTQNDMNDGYRLTHLTYFNVGSDRNIKYNKTDGALSDYNQEAEIYRNKKIDVSRKVSSDKNLNFVFVDSNISDIYQGLFEHSFVYRSMAAALSMQGYWGVYLFSSAGHSIDVYTPSLLTEPGSYDKLILECLSTKNISLTVAGGECTRLDKTNLISDDQITQKFLNVCSKDTHCLKCTKCYRTALTLELLGKLKYFSAVFNLREFEKMRYKAYAWMLDQKNSNSHAKQVYELYKNTNTNIPFKTFPYLVARKTLKFAGFLRTKKRA